MKISKLVASGLGFALVVGLFPIKGFCQTFNKKDGIQKNLQKAEMLSRNEGEKERKGYKKDLAVKVVSQELGDREVVRAVGDKA
ncbi:MAG: hypothetical protein F3739_06200 [Nitrospinae bacterium]|nr:hypothetical protein [Nitrospinota bacterium]